MQPQFSLIDNLYNNILQTFDTPQNFIEWDETDDLKAGKICTSYAWYEKEYRWYLKTHTYKPSEEYNSLWTAHKYSLTGDNLYHDQYVKKYFGLEDEENLVSVPGKCRPVILIKDYKWDWMQPRITSKQLDKWLVIPIFSYKNRHSQDYRYKIRDFCFQSPDKAYIPKMYGVEAGMEDECVAHINSMQLIRKEYIKSYKVNYTSSTSRKGIKLSDKALKIILYHHMKYIDMFDVFNSKKGDSDKTEYDVFVWAIKDAIKIALAKQGLQDNFL